MMKKILLFGLTIISIFGYAQNLPLWNGETSNIKSCKFVSGDADSLNPHSGKWCFKATPDQWHKSQINLECQNTWRSDISGYDEIRFYAKSNVRGKKLRFSVSGWPDTSRSVEISRYIEGGILDTVYNLVKIPIDSLKWSQYKLQSIEYFGFDTTKISNCAIYIDDIIAMDTKANKIDTFAIISNQALRLDINNSYDTVDTRNLINYSLSSNDDPDFAIAINPTKVGLHYFTTSFSSQGGPNPNLKYEIFNEYSAKMKNGKHYNMTVFNVRDKSGNNFPVPQMFSFIFNDKIFTNSVKVNQIGYVTKGSKLAYIGSYLGSAGMLMCNPDTFEIRNASNDNVVYIGKPVFRRNDSTLSGEKVYECNFSSFENQGRYYLYVPGLGKSYNFKIADYPYDSVYYHTARELFYQRCGMALQPPYADARWSHGACHLNDGVSDTTQKSSLLYNDEPIGVTIPAIHGWHDAGDYGKYSITAAVSLYYLFTAYQLYPQKFTDYTLNIPETGNGVPDILDEAKWEVDWYKEMQAPDGGVYDRITTPAWASTMPELDNDTRYINEKTTFATALFVASMAMAYNNFHPFWPIYADTCLAKAERAWHFLELHPNPIPADGYKPTNGVGGGDYPDPGGDVDDRAWATAELYKATGKTKYDSLFHIYWAANPPMWGWNEFQHHQIKASLAYATTTKYPTNSSSVAAFKNEYKFYLDRTLIPQADSNAYRNSYRSDVPAWIGWGSFSHSTKYAWDFIIGSILCNDPIYLEYAKINLNSQLGNNPQNICYITGLGNKSPKDPLQDPSLYDGVTEPVPGICVFGPSAHMSFANPYDAAVQRKVNLYPFGESEFDAYPILRRYFDCHQNVGMSEFGITIEAQFSSTYAFFNRDNITVATPEHLNEINQDKLFQNQPNPFPHFTTISFELATNELIDISLYNIQGEKIETLANGKYLKGFHSLDIESSKLSSGIYFYKLTTANGVISKKLNVLK